MLKRKKKKNELKKDEKTTGFLFSIKRREYRGRVFDRNRMKAEVLNKRKSFEGLRALDTSQREILQRATNDREEKAQKKKRTQKVNNNTSSPSPS